MLFKYYGVLPDGIDKDNISPEQREFLFFLLGNTPSIETVQKIVEYETRLDDINRKNYKRRVVKEEGKDKLNLLAKANKMSFDDYINKLAKERKDIELKALKEVFGIKDKNKEIESQKEKVEKYFKATRETLKQEAEEKEKTKQKENLLFMSKDEIVKKLKKERE